MIDDANALMRKMTEDSEALARQSTQLSELLERAEEFLNSLPGKVRTEVDAVVDDNEYLLVFDRAEGIWGLRIVGRGEPAEWVTSSSVFKKSVAARLLPLLISEMVESQEAKLRAVEEGLESLKEVSFLRKHAEGE